jgi:cob(I)alamin adenosyltransferase
MVRLTKIYTRTGDDGTTGLGGGGRVSKSSPRVEAYGTVDEANAAIGLAVCEAEAAGAAAAPIADVLRSVQHDLFDVGADLCTPVEAEERAGARLRIQAAQSARLEPIIDRFNEPLGSLTSFVLPGGTSLAAALHLARTITRRAERLTVLLAEAEPRATAPEPVRYLNRLSDLLFVLARAANRLPGGAGDVLWKPGASRPGQDLKGQEPGGRDS